MSYIGEWTYDVYLSFRGADTRTGFTGHLYNSLNSKDIITFLDGVDLKSGKDIHSALLNAIQQSRIAIIVFSEHYAHSTFCLDELVNILEYVNGQGRFVLPVYYGTFNSSVWLRYGEPMIYEAQKVNKWREALNAVANLSGLHYQRG